MDTFGSTDGWSDYGGYFEAKKRKLLDQFDDERARRDRRDDDTSVDTGQTGNLQIADKEDGEARTELFKNIAVFINGYTDPPALELRRIMMQHGGLYHAYLRKGLTTHVIATNLPFAKQIQLKGERIVRPQWIVDSISHNMLLDWKRYELYPTAGAQQPSKRMKPDTARALPVASATEQRKQTSGGRPSDLNEQKSTTSLHRQNSNDVAASGPPVEDARNPEFVRNFYQKSRLHHLSTWKSEFQQLVGDIQNQAFPNFPGFERLSEQVARDTHHSVSEVAPDRYSAPPVVMHIDMDCFFVSVGLLQNPHLRGKPVCICHARTGRGRREDEPQHNHDAFVDTGSSFSSMSEIASCSYEARAKGVKNGMMFGRARQLCPDLQALPYQFDEYNRISKLLYYAVAEYTHEMEAISCDELYVDCSRLLKNLRATPEQFAGALRSDIFTRTGCPASAGLGPNKLLARLATKRAKPDGQFYLNRQADEHKVLDYIASLPVTELPGVGRAMECKFKDLDVKLVGDLRRTPVGVLQSKFGTFMGRKLHDMSCGIDDKPVENVTSRKSISLEINYGIRLSTLEEFERFFSGFCEELERRMRAAHVQGTHITLKLLVRRPGEPLAPDKFMGHGKCNVFSKSEQLAKPVDNKADLYRTGMALLRSVMSDQVEMSDLRGVGLHVGKLNHLQLTTEAEPANGIMKYLNPSGSRKVLPLQSTVPVVEKNILEKSTSGLKFPSAGKNVAPPKKPRHFPDNDFATEEAEISRIDDLSDDEAVDNESENFLPVAKLHEGLASDAPVTTKPKTACLDEADVFAANPLDTVLKSSGHSLRFEAMQQMFLSTNPDKLYAIYGREKIDRIRRRLLRSASAASSSDGLYIDTQFSASLASSNNSNSAVENLPNAPDFSQLDDEFETHKAAYDEYAGELRRRSEANLSNCPPYNIDAVERANALTLHYRDDPVFLRVRDADTVDNSRLDAAKRNVKRRDRLMAVSWYYKFPAGNERLKRAALRLSTPDERHHTEGINHAQRRRVAAHNLYQPVSASQHRRDVAKILNENHAKARPDFRTNRLKGKQYQPTITQAVGTMLKRNSLQARGSENRMQPFNNVDEDEAPALLIDELLAASNPSQLVRTRMAHLLPPTMYHAMKAADADNLVPSLDDGKCRSVKRVCSESEVQCRHADDSPAGINYSRRASCDNLSIFDANLASFVGKHADMPGATPAQDATGSVSNHKQASKSTVFPSTNYVPATITQLLRSTPLSLSTYSVAPKFSLHSPQQIGTDKKSSSRIMRTTGTTKKSSLSSRGSGSRARGRIGGAAVRQMSKDMLRFVGGARGGHLSDRRNINKSKPPKFVSLEDTICLIDDDSGGENSSNSELDISKKNL